MKAPHAEPDREGDPIECLRNALRLSAVFWLLIAVSVLAAGCAPDTRRFYRDNTTQQDYDRDAYQCELEARQVERSFGYGYDRGPNAFAFLVRCMGAKGYVFQ